MTWRRFAASRVGLVRGTTHTAEKTAIRLPVTSRLLCSCSPFGRPLPALPRLRLGSSLPALGKDELRLRLGRPEAFRQLEVWCVVPAHLGPFLARPVEDAVATLYIGRLDIETRAPPRRARQKSHLSLAPATLRDRTDGRVLQAGRHERNTKQSYKVFTYLPGTLRCALHTFACAVGIPSHV